MKRPRVPKHQVAMVKGLLAAVEAGDREAAAVLHDWMLENGLGNEFILGSLRGFAHSVPEPFAGTHRAGIVHARSHIFPPRSAPCLVSRKGFFGLVAKYDGNVRAARNAWRAMKGACRSNRARAYEEAMLEADQALRGHGVEAIYSRSDLVATYVNVGETYSTTLLLDEKTGRFWLTSWGDWVEAWERRNRRSLDE